MTPPALSISAHLAQAGEIIDAIARATVRATPDAHKSLSHTGNEGSGMSGAYSLFRLQPIHVHGKGEVAPEGYVSDAQREMMEAVQRGAGAGNTHGTSGGNANTTSTTPDPWGDLR